MAKTALIIGISGQDGAWLSRFLLDKGYVVHGTSRDAEAHRFNSLRSLGLLNRVKLHSAAPTDFRSMLAVMKSVAADEVYNLSGQSSVSLSFTQPIESFESISVSTLNILEIIRLLELPARFYNASSSECYGDTGHAAASETTPFRPVSPYAVAKAAAFWSVANYRDAYKLFACSGILFNHESGLRPDRFVTRKIVTAAVDIAEGSQEKLRLGDLSIHRDWGWAPEYVEAMHLMLQQEKPDDYVIATGQDYSLEEFVATAFREVGLDWHAHVEIDRTLFRPTEIRRSRGDAAKAKRVLGWQAVTSMPAVVMKMVAAERARRQSAAEPKP